MKYKNYKYRKPLNCGANSKQCGGACVDKNDICSRDKEVKIDKGIVVVREELSSLEKGGSPGKVFNKTVATLLIEDKSLGQKLPHEMADVVAKSRTIDDRVKKSYIDSATTGTYNMGVSPKEIILKNEDRNFINKISNRYMVKDSKSPARTIINNGTDSERNFFKTENGKNVLKLLGATAIVGATTALAAYSLKSKQSSLPEKDTISIENDVNKSYLKKPTNIEADEIVNESLRRTNVVNNDTIKDNVKRAGDSAYSSQSVHEEYKDIYDGAMKIEKERQMYGADKFSLRQEEDYQAYWGKDAKTVTGKAVATSDSRLGRAEIKLEERIRELDSDKSEQEIRSDISKAKAMIQNKELLDSSRSTGQVYDPKTKTWEHRTYSNGLDSNNPDYSNSQDILIREQQRKNLEKSYLDPDGSTYEMDKFQQDGVFARADRNKGNVPIVDIDDIKQRHNDAYEYDNTRVLSPKERWSKLNNAGDGKNKLLSMFIDAEIAKDLSDGTINESGSVLFSMKSQRDKSYESVSKVLSENTEIDLNILRENKLKELNTSINNGHDIFPVKPSYVIEESNISKTDNIKDRFGALGSTPKNLSPEFIPERYRDELSNEVLKSQSKDWNSLSKDRQDSYLNSQILKDASRGEVYEKELMSGTKQQRKVASEYIMRELLDKYNNDTDIIDALREIKRKDIERAINNEKAVLPEYTAQTSSSVSGQDDKDYGKDEKHIETSDIGTIGNVASVDASNGGPKQKKASDIAKSKAQGSFNIFEDTGNKYIKKGFSNDGKSNTRGVQIIKDRTGQIFKKRGKDFFINGEKIPMVYIDGNGNKRNRTINEILEIMYRQFQFSENYSTHDMKVQEILEHNGNVTIFSTINHGIVSVIYDIYNDTFSCVPL